MVQGTTGVGASRLCNDLRWPMMTHAAWATGSADGLGVWVTGTCFPIICRETSLRQVGGALLLVFRAEHLLLFNRQPWCHDLPAWVTTVAVECISIGHDFLQIFHASGAQRWVEMI